MIGYASSLNTLKHLSIDILYIEGTTILTTIPCLKHEKILFEQDKSYALSHQSDTFLYQYETTFSGVRTILNHSFYAFTILTHQVLENIRKETRMITSHSASFMEKGNASSRLGTIIDMSESGMKLETPHSIQKSEVHLFIEKGKEKEYKIAEIMWKKKQNDMYYYGLQTVMAF